MRLALVAALVCACGGGGAGGGGPEVEVPARAETAGDPLLASLPAGAQIVVEIDLSRLRANPVVGPLVEELATIPRETLVDWVRAAGGTVEILVALARDADAAVLAAYNVGTDEAATLIAVRGGASLTAAAELPNGVRVAGPDGWIPRAQKAAAGSEPDLAGDRKLLAVRAAAMPPEARAAWLRVTAKLDFDARVSLASRFGLELVPVSVSVWSDVIDDMAFIALLGGDKPGETRELARGMDRLRDRLATSRLVRYLGLSYTLQRAEIDGNDELARLILIVSPGRLERVIAKLARELG